MKWIRIPGSILVLVLVGLTWIEISQSASTSGSVFNPPVLEDLPSGEEGEAIRLGYQIVTNTQQYAKGYVGNGLNCRNCHLEAGRVPHALPYVGVFAAYPAYRARAGRVVTIEDRINECFERSMNGTPLPFDSEPMRALVSYMAWLSREVPVGAILHERGVPAITASRPPDAVRGKTVFAAKCASCHGADGHGTPNAPPLWGPRSFNIGAGMARLSKAAGFIKQSMPLGQAGSLTAAEAYDVAAYITGQPRPDFPGKDRDWPKGGKPADSPY